MIEIDPQSSLPLNDQIKAGLRGLVAKGLLKPGDLAPSVRALAAELKVNPNTVARAFRELALEGFFETRRGDGSYVAEDAVRRAQKGLDGVRDTLAEAVKQARRGGLSRGDVEKAVRQALQEEDR